MKSQPYPSIAQSFGIVGILILSVIVFSPVFLAINNAVDKQLAYLLHYLLSMTVPIWLFVKLGARELSSEEYKIKIGDARLIGLLAITTVALGMGVTGPLSWAIPISETFQNFILELYSHKGIFSFLMIVVAAPLIEETIFRGIMLDGLLRRYSPTKAIILSSILFGAIHLNPWQFVSAFVLGIFIGWVYYRTKKLMFAITIHLANNLTAFIGMHFTNYEELIEMTFIEMYGGAFNTILIIGGAILVLFFCLQYLNKQLGCGGRNSIKRQQ